MTEKKTTNHLKESFFYRSNYYLNAAEPLSDDSKTKKKIKAEVCQIILTLIPSDISIVNHIL